MKKPPKTCVPEKRSSMFFIVGLLSLLCFSFVVSSCSDYSGNEQIRPGYGRYQYGNLPIMSRGKASALQLTNFFLRNNHNINRHYLDKLAQTYVHESNKEGVNSDVAFCQMCVETNFLKFGNQVKAHQNNFAGLGATDDGANGHKFRGMTEGVRAQIQHLKAYASTQALNDKNVDPRFHLVRRGSARYVSQLGNGIWASDPYYASKIIRMLNDLYYLSGIT